MKKVILTVLFLLVTAPACLSAEQEPNIDSMSLPEYVEYCEKLPWEGEFTSDYGITYQYKKYPRWVDVSKAVPEQFPVNYKASPLYCFIAHYAIIMQPSVTEEQQKQVFGFYKDLPLFKKFMAEQFPDIQDEAALLKRWRKENLQKWCVGEVRSGNRSVILSITAGQTPSPRVSNHDIMPSFFCEENGRIFWEGDFNQELFQKIMLDVTSSLFHAGEPLYKAFYIENKKYPSIPRWRCWCNKDRTKATLAELVKIDDHTITLKKYEDKKRVQVKIEDLYIEDQFLLERLWEESEENKATNKSKTKKVNSSKRSKKKTKEAEAESHED